MKNILNLLVIFIIPNIAYSQNIMTDFNYEDVLEDVVDRSTLELGYNLANYVQGSTTDNNGSLLRDLNTQGAFRAGGRFTYMYLPKYFSLAAGLAYETPRKMNWQSVSGFALNDYVSQQRLSYWELNATINLDLPWFWEAYLGANYSLPIISNALADVSGRLGFIAGGNYWWNRNMATGIAYRINNFSYKTAFQTSEMSLAGLEVRFNLKFL